MKKEFITLSVLSSSLILFYFLFPVLQENIFKKEINVNKKEDLYLDQFNKEALVVVLLVIWVDLINGQYSKAFYRKVPKGKSIS